MSAPTTTGAFTATAASDGEPPAQTGKAAPVAGRWPQPPVPAALPAGPPAERVGRKLRALVTGTVGELRFVSERPPSLLEHLGYARRGEWTEEIDGPRRQAGLIYAWLVAVPLSTVAYLLAWAVARPGRFASMLTVGLLSSTAVAQIPALAWLVPDWLTL